MATDPSQLLIGLLNAPGLIGQQSQQNLLSQQQYQLGQQQQQFNAARLAGAQREQQQQAQFQQEVAGHQGVWSPQDIFNLSLKYPDQAQQFSAAAKSKDEAQRQADLGFFGSVYSAAKNNKPDLAIKQLQSRRDAERAAGVDTSDVDGIIQDLQAGKPEALGELQNFSLAQIYAHDPDQFAKVFNLDNGGNVEGKVVGRSIGHYEGNKFVVDYSAPQDESNAIEVPVFNEQGQRIGTRLVPNGGKGGDPASSGASGRTFGGWTPRSRNGGDNSDEAVDGKLSGMSSALGIDTSAQFPASMTNRQIFDALTLSEGGKGSLADRNNNPGNLTDPKTGGYRKFPTKAAGIAAGVAQVARNRARGQNSIQSMVEGLPVGGSSNGYIGPQATSASDPSNMTGQAYLSTLPKGRQALIQAIAEGRAPAPKPGTRFGQQLTEDLAQAYPNVDTTSFQSRQKARTDFTGNGKGAQNVSALNRFFAHLNDAYELHLKLAGPNLGPLSGLAAGAAQSFDQQHVNDYNTAIEGLQGEFQKLTKNGQGNESEAARLIKSAEAAQSSNGRLGALQALAKLAAAQVKPLHDQWSAAFPDRKIPIDISSASRAIYQNVVNNNGHALPIDSGGTPIVPPPRTAVSYLRSHPNLRSQFDAKYGRGAAAWALSR